MNEVITTLGDTAKAALAEKEKTDAVSALLESKAGDMDVVVDEEIEEILKVAKEAEALTGTMTNDDDGETETAADMSTPDLVEEAPTVSDINDDETV